MSDRYISISSDRERLRSYSATSKAGRHIVRIELEVRDPVDLGYLLESLARFEAAQKAAARPAPRRSAKARALPGGQLLLVHHRDE